MASRRHVRLRSCTTKHRYDTPQRAQQARLRMEATGIVVGVLRAYWCPFCAFWHLGHIAITHRKGA
jgi:hypothetical protein